MPVVINPTSMSFALQQSDTASSAQTCTVANGDSEAITLTAPAHFSVTPSRVDGGATTDVSVTYEPTAAGDHSGSIDIGGQTLSLTGEAFELSFSPTSVAFGTRAVGSKVDETVSVTYTRGTGSGSVTLSTTGSGFSVAPTTVTASSNPTDLVVSFSPTAASAHTGDLEAKLGGTTIKASLSGTGTSTDSTTQESGYTHTSETDERYNADGDYAGKDASLDESADKYWEVEVDHPFDGGSLNSYLRLGSPEPSSLTPSRSNTANASDVRGHDLAYMFDVFYDDDRFRGSHPPAAGDRTTLTQQMYTKGGWRDHSDGNRISTTRGDKIEVIRGNYQLLVLGRQDDPGNGARWESGGGHWARDHDTMTPGAVMEVRWDDTPWGGTWKVISETVKGDVINRYHGTTTEEYYGDTVTTTVGSEDEGPIPGGGARKTASGGGGNASTNWVSDVAGLTKKRPEVVSNTYAKSVTEKTHVYGANSGDTIIDGTDISHTAVLGGFKGDFTEVVGLFLETTNAIVHISEEASLALDLYIGLKIEIDLSAKLCIAPKDNSIDLEISKSGIHKKKDEVALAKQELNKKINSVSAEVLDVAKQVNKVRGKVTKLANEEKKIVNNITYIGVNMKMLAVQVNFF